MFTTRPSCNNQHVLGFAGLAPAVKRNVVSDHDQLHLRLSAWLPHVVLAGISNVLALVDTECQASYLHLSAYLAFFTFFAGESTHTRSKEAGEKRQPPSPRLTLGVALLRELGATISGPCL